METVTRLCAVQEVVGEQRPGAGRFAFLSTRARGTCSRVPDAPQLVFPAGSACSQEMSVPDDISLPDLFGAGVCGTDGAN